MTFNIKTITVKNFLSVGNQTQAVDFDKEHLTLILGKNLDLGGDDSGSRNGTGKAQPLDSNILTPTGWKRMGDINIDDEVITASGKISHVTGVFPQGRLPVYKLTFKDGRTCKASGDHLWETYSHLFNLKSDSNKTRISTTEDIIKLLDRKNNRPNSGASSHIYIPLITPFDHEDINLPIDPWLLGFLIGDGSFSKSTNGMSFTSADPYLIEKVNMICLRDFNCMVKSKGIEHSITMIQRTQKHPIRVAIKNLNLDGHLSYTKFIPDIYKTASIEQKLALLQGLMDSDGNVDRRTGSVTYSTVSEQLSNDIAYIVRSIGGIARIFSRENRSYVYKNNRKSCADTYNISIRYNDMKSLVSLPRKKDLIKQNYQYADRLRLQIVNIEAMDTAECQCISIDDKSHLYVTDNFIVTHNTTMINALSYALYGHALSNIRKEYLINNINSKAMLVTVEFEKNGIIYRIERGRKPNILKLYENNKEKKATDDSTDESQGDSRETQKYIEQLLGMSHTMFKHLVALNTYTEPFLSMRTSDQREIIEQLLGITVLSEKAETLKALIKTSKDAIQSETFKIEGIKKANQNVQKSIDSISIKSSAWENKKNQDLEILASSILELSDVNIERELQLHADIKEWKNRNSKKNQLISQKATLQAALTRNEKVVLKYHSQLTALDESKNCPSCDQELQDHKHEEMIIQARADFDEATKYGDNVSNDLLLILNEIETIGDLVKPAEPFYDTEAEALSHQNNLSNLEKTLENRIVENNPYLEQVEELKNTAIQEINWDTVNELTKVKDHQEFLHKLLINKDSFIRKKIIDQNLSYLNKRLSYYISKMGLPHLVVFQNDLSVDITQLGQELDFDNLSRGERNRLILSLSFAFRDVWENLYQHINLLFVDELLDSGMDPAGIESGLGVLKKMARERNKNIFLISHKEELIGRVNNVLHVIKENGFTSYDNNSELVDSV